VGPLPSFARYVLNALPVAAAIAALGTSHDWIAWAIAGAALLGSIVAYYFVRNRYHHHLTEGTPKFVKFYKEWYARGGHHSIYCDDLAWLDAAENEPIVDQLKSNGARAQVWIAEDTSPRVAQLKSAGVQVSVVPSIAEIHVPMSLHEHEDSKDLIIRAKARYGRDGRDAGRRTIDFIEARDPYLIALSSEFFRFCRHVADMEDPTS
jgi:hypothetical protein